MASPLLIPPAPPLALQMGPTGPATPVGGPAANLPSQSPVHDYVRANPQATADDVSQKFGLPPVIAQSVVADVRGPQQSAMVPPALSQALSPVVPPKPAAAMPAPLANALAPASVPSPAPAQPQFPSSVMAAPQSAPSTPPSASPATPPASPAQAQTPTGWPVDMQNRLTLQNNAATQPNGTFPTDSAPNIAPGAQPAPFVPPAKQPSRLQQLAPLLIAGILGSRNPQSGASLLQGWQAGQMQNQALQAQRDAIARQNAQQQFENQQEIAKAAQGQQQQAFENRQTFEDALLKRDPAGQERMVNGLSDADAKALGIDKASFYGADGKFIPQTSAEKPLDPVALARVQASNYDKLQGLTTESQQNIHDSMDEGEWKATYGVPYDDFKPVQRQKDVTDEEKATTAQQKVDDAARLIGPKIDQINAQAGLAKSRTNYYDLTTPQKVKIYQQTARLLGLKANDQKDLDTAKMAYEKALGNAATSNAESNAFNAETRAELTQAQIHKLSAETKATEQRVQQVAAKDPYFSAMVSLRNNANDLKAKALANKDYDAPTRARIIAGYDADIRRADDYIQGRMSSSGGQITPPQDTSQAPVVGNPASRSAVWSTLSPSPQYGGNYRQIIVRTANKYGVDPAAVQAIIKRESSGNAGATNRNNNGTTDYGIMQVNSATKDPASYDWRNPEANIDAGVAEFAAKLRASNGDYHQAFHLYNGLGAPSSRYADPVFSDYQRLKNGGQRTASVPQTAPRIESAPTGTLAPDQIKSMSTADLLKRLASKYAK